MKNLIIASIFIVLISFVPITSFGLANTPWIPPTNAYGKAKYPNGTITTAKSYNSLLDLSSLGSSGTNQGTYNKTLANNVLVNSGGNRLNFINSTNNPVNIKNDPTRNQVNITISSASGSGTVTGSHNGGKASNSVGTLATGTSTQVIGRNLTGTSPITVTKTNDTDISIGCALCLLNAVTSLNFTTNNDFDFHSGNRNVTYTTLNGQVFNLHVKPNVVLTNESAQIIFKSITLNSGILGGNLVTTGFGFSNGGHVSTPPPYTGQICDQNQTAHCGTDLFNGTITSINSQTGPVININRGSVTNMSTITNSSNAISYILDTNLVKQNGNNQTFHKGVNFNNGAKITGLFLNATSKINSYTLTSTDDLILVNATSGNLTITIPNINTIGKGKLYEIKKIDFSKNFVKILPTSSTIDYNSNMNITNPMDDIKIQNNGTTWFTTNKLIYTENNKALKQTANNWFGSWVTQGTPTTFTLSNNTLYATPFDLSRSTSLSKIQFEITSAGAGTVQCRLGIYTDSGSGYPLNKISGTDVTVLAGNSTGVQTNTFSSNKHLSEGKYFLASECNSSTGNHGLATITTDVIASATTASSTTNATQNISITVGNNAKRALVVGVSYLKGASTPNTNNAVISSITFDSASFTKAVNRTRNNATQGFSYDSEIWYLLNPSIKTGHITITPVTTTQYFMVTSAYSLYNVNQTSPLGATANNGTTTRSSSIAITPTFTKSWLIENIMGIPMTSPTAVPTSPSDTQAWASITGTGGSDGASEYKTAPSIGSSNKMTWQWPNPATSRQNTADTAIELKAATTTPGTQPTVRSIPTTSLSADMGMPGTMGGTNGGTMYETTTALTSSLTALPDPFPSSYSIDTTDVPEILINVVG